MSEHHWHSSLRPGPLGVLLASSACSTDPSPTLPPSVWYSEAMGYLLKQDHWWCQHGTVTSGLCETLGYYNFANGGQDSPRSLLRLWEGMCKQLSVCTACICKYRQYQDEVLYEKYEEPDADVIRAVFQRLDAQRLTQWLEEAAPALAKSPEALPSSLVCALYECLSNPQMLNDSAVAEALIAAVQSLTTLGYDMLSDSAVAEALMTAVQSLAALGYDEGESGRYPGLYKMLAYPDTSARAAFHAVVQHLGPFEQWSDFTDTNLSSVSLDLPPRPHIPQNAATGRGGAAALSPSTFRHALTCPNALLLAALSPSTYRHALTCPNALLLAALSPSTYRHALTCLNALLLAVGEQLWVSSSAEALVDILINGFQSFKEPATHLALLTCMQSTLKMMANASWQRLDQAMAQLLHFLLHQSTAAVVALSSIHRAIAAGFPSSFVAHLWGSVASRAVCAPLPKDPKLLEASTKMICAILQVDASVLGALLDPDLLGATPNVISATCVEVEGDAVAGGGQARDGKGGPRTRHICSSIDFEDGVDMSSGSQLLAAAAHLAGVDQQADPACQEQAQGGLNPGGGSTVQSGGFLQGGPFGRGADHGPREGRGALGVAPEVDRALKWQPAWGSNVGGQDQTVLSAAHPWHLLAVLRRSAESHLIHAARVGHVLGDGAGLLDQAPPAGGLASSSPAPKPSQGGIPPSTLGAALTLALVSALRLMIGVHPGLREAAAHTLAVQLHLQPGSGVQEEALVEGQDQDGDV
eukprot:gene3399-13439_t